MAEAIGISEATKEFDSSKLGIKYESAMYGHKSRNHIFRAESVRKIT